MLEAATLDVQSIFNGHSRSVVAASWVHGDSLVATAGVDQTIQLWEAANGAARRTLSNHVGTVNDLAFRPDVKEGPPILASVSEDKTVRLWQPIIGRLMRFAKLPSAPRTFVWLPSGDYLAVGCNDGVVRVLDFDELKIVQELAGDVGRIHAMALHAKDGKIVVGGERGIRAAAIPDLAAK
jgi:WD40 repeat protein